MNRKILPPIIVALTLTVTLGVLASIRVFAAPTAETSLNAAPSNAAGADFTVDPLILGQFAQAGSTSSFRVAIENTGETPTDIYELTVESGWPAALYGPDGTTPLTDTNASGSIDTGPVSQGVSLTIVARVDTPANSIIGDSNEMLVEVRSSVSPTLVYTAYMRTAVPAPFAQTLYQQQEANIHLLMSQPSASWRSQTLPADYYDRPDTLPGLALAETDSGYFYLWTNQRPINSVWRSELEYLFTDKPGQPTSGVSKLTNHASVTQETLDIEPAVAVASNGNIGVAWYRTTKFIDASVLYNIYLAILDPTGQPITDTINVTNNTRPRLPEQPGFDRPSLIAPRIAATGDDHFFVAWESSILTYTEKVTQTYTLDDIYYAIYATDGVSVTDPINVSNNVPGESNRSLHPAMTGVNVDRVFLSWAQRRPAEQGGEDVLYTVIDSANTTQKPKTEMAADEVTLEWSNLDVVELSTGEIVAAWGAYGCPGYEWSERIRYAVFRANNYNRIGQPSCLPPTVIAEDDDGGVSLVADNQGHAILTWTDREASKRYKLYYALVSANGHLATEPMIFYQNEAAEGLLSTGLYGYASASRIFLDAAVAINPQLRKGGPDDPIPFAIGYRNDGAVTGTSVVLTLTLAPSLTYVASNASSPPAVDGQQFVWTLDDLGPWSRGSFDVSVSISPTAKLIHTYPLTATIAVDGPEATLSNNSALAGVVFGYPLFIPNVVGPN